mgnify:CR=1 FL=1
MNVAEVRKHGEKYSKSFNSQTSKWQLDFPAMGLKTVIKMLLSKYGILSVEMRESMKFDEAVVEEKDGEKKVTYPDSTIVDIEHTDLSKETSQQNNLPNSNDL